MRVDPMVIIGTIINILVICIYKDQLTDEDRQLLERLYKDASLAINSVEKLYVTARTERQSEGGKVIKRDLAKGVV